MNTDLQIVVAEFPQKIEHLVCEELEEMGSYVYIHEHDGTTITLNAVASAVFDMCDGRHSAEHIAREISDTLDVDFAVALRDVSEVLAELSGFGFFQE